MFDDAETLGLKSVVEATRRVINRKAVILTRIELVFCRRIVFEVLILEIPLDF